MRVWHLRRLPSVPTNVLFLSFHTPTYLSILIVSSLPLGGFKHSGSENFFPVGQSGSSLSGSWFAAGLLSATLTEFVRTWPVKLMILGEMKNENALKISNICKVLLLCGSEMSLDQVENTE